MNCKHVQELLPLYAGRDLEGKGAQMVMAHVQSCVECAGSVDEYRETRQLLKQFAPPPASDAVYAGIRQRVLREIEQEAAAPGLSRLLDSLFRPRLRWAVATALALAVSVFALYFIANRRNNQQQVAGSGRTLDVPTSPSIRGVDVRPVQKRDPVRGLAGITHQSLRRKSSGAAADRSRSTTVNSTGPGSMSAQTLPNENNTSEADAVPAGESARPEKTLRVEMQTKDPNIRIIWFSRSPNSKFSKGT